MVSREFNIEQMLAISRSGTLELIATKMFEIDPSPLVETDSLFFKESDLCFPDARLSFRVHHSLPGDGRFYYVRTQRRQRPANLPRRTGRTDQICHLPVGGDLSGWNPSNDVIDPLIDSLAQD